MDLSSQFVKDLIRTKLNEAVPNALVTAATRYQLTLDKHLDFPAFLDAAIQIGHKLQAETMTKKRPAPATAAASLDAKKKGKPSAAIPDMSLDDDAFLKKYDRCGVCAWRLKPGQSYAGHRATSDCNPLLKDGRIKGMKLALAAGKDPNSGFPKPKGSPVASKPVRSGSPKPKPGAVNMVAEPDLPAPPALKKGVRYTLNEFHSLLDQAAHAAGK